MSQTLLEKRRQLFKLEKIKMRNLKEITLMCVHADGKSLIKRENLKLLNRTSNPYQTYQLSKSLAFQRLLDGNP